MELEVFKVLISGLGGGGVAVGAAYLMFKSYQGAIGKKDEILISRVDILEEAAKECASDREKLHQQIHELETGVIRETNDVIRENTRALVETKKVFLSKSDQ